MKGDVKKSPVMKYVVTCIALSGLIASASAGTWYDDFEDENLDGWKDMGGTVQGGRPVHWQAKNGTLQIDFRGRIPGLPLNRPVALFWLPMQANQAEFTVSCEFLEISTSVVGVDQYVGLLIGGVPSASHFGDEVGAFGRKKRDLYPWMYYAFFTKSVRFAAFSFDIGIVNRLISDAEVEYPELQQMTIHFNNGHFQLLSAGKLVYEFTDTHFQHIDQVYLLAHAYDLYTRIDNFVISGPMIPDNRIVSVKSRGKVTTTWGAIKQSKKVATP